ncbi:FAD:protein FMN transferase [Microaerobacter geothermalis]|uniref:FAD:protein FMN transferase n=1 Tax=Microaerobacter geothermalis TaxID=674972 RepID=UPI001F3354B3|nr:FAD:protein FMN transferase [Microaerobacter geothermalis]MCF6092494.1 FAD:protein FMN transferase [Microaerobacter geothermalis]
MRKICFFAMNTEVELVLDTEEVELFSLGRDWFQYVEQKLSRFLPGSELSFLNHSPSKPMIVSELFYEVAEKGIYYWKRTHSLFCPFLGKHLVNLGYNCSFEQLKEYPYQEEVRVNTNPSVLSSSIPITLYPEMKALKLSSSYQLDFGGLAKGWSCEKLSDMLKHTYQIPSGYINAGGDLQVWDNQSKDWHIEIKSPYSTEEIIAVIQISNGGVATSSCLQRQWIHQGMKVHHILDPRTGMPADTDIIQATVYASSVTEAEVWAKIFCILGEQEGTKYIKERAPFLEWVLVKKDGEIITSSFDTLHGNVKKVV